MKSISMDSNLEFTQFITNKLLINVEILININNEAIMLGYPAKYGLSCRVRAIRESSFNMTRGGWMKILKLEA